jgi:copper chaperone NosL
MIAVHAKERMIASGGLYLLRLLRMDGFDSAAEVRRRQACPRSEGKDRGMEKPGLLVESGAGKGKGRIVLLAVAALAALLWTSVLWAGEQKPAKPGPKDKCPVCGMFVYKYPDFVAQVVFKDGSSAFFDGAKDMFKYYFDVRKFDPKRKQTDIGSVYVTDYYGLTLIDATKAFYVVGSDVYGPMGRELIPFEKESEAKGFLKDHKGKSLVMFQDVNQLILKGLD